MATITYRTNTGFGEATNGAILWQLRDLLLPLSDEELDAYVECILAPVPLYIYKTFDQTTTRAALWPWRNLHVPRLLRLPEELLLQIAGNIDGESRNRDLSNLSLTCRRLQKVAQETLSWSAIIYPHNLRECFDRLVRNPSKMLKLSSISFGEAHGVRDGLGSFAQKHPDFGWLRYGSHPPYSETLSEIRLNPQLGHILQGFRCDVSSIERSMDPAASTIFAFLPNLTELVVTDSFIEASEVSVMFEGDGEFPWLDVWPWPALFRIQAQIRTLVVKQRDPTSLYLDSAQMSRRLFDGFKNLVDLSLTAPLLIFRFNPHVQVIDTLIDGTGLPNSLKTLCIFVGLENFYDLIGWLERFLQCVPATGSGVREYWHCWGFTVKLMMGTTYDFFMEWLPTCNQHTQ